MFKLFGQYNGVTEMIDTFDSMEEAQKMLNEYRLAYGSTWNLYIKMTRDAKE